MQVVMNIGVKEEPVRTRFNRDPKHARSRAVREPTEGSHCPAFSRRTYHIQSAAGCVWSWAQRIIGLSSLQRRDISEAGNGISFVREPGGAHQSSGNLQAHDFSLVGSIGAGRWRMAPSSKAGPVARLRRRGPSDIDSGARTMRTPPASFHQSPRGCTGGHTKKKRRG